MDDVSSVVRTVVQWIVPGAGLVLMWLAWRRFRVRGTMVAAVGYGVMLAVIATSDAFRGLLLDQEDFSRDALNRVTLITGLMTVLGPVLLVVALRKMIAEVAPIAADVIEDDQYEIEHEIEERVR
jgi:hypothetical protein